MHHFVHTSFHPLLPNVPGKPHIHIVIMAVKLGKELMVAHSLVTYNVCNSTFVTKSCNGADFVDQIL